MTKFYIVGSDVSVAGVWRGFGCQQTREMAESDIVILTGGADINPAIYGEQAHESMYYSRNSKRDEYEIEQYYEAVAAGKNVFGICRGGQLAHCLNGGKLWQHINNHVSNGHMLKDHKTGKLHRVSSCHHQMMRVDPHPRQNEEFEIVATASGISNKREMWDQERHLASGYYQDDIEVLWYPRVKTICYQSHPEFGIDTDTRYAYELQRRFGFLPGDSPVVMPAPKPEPRGWDFWNTIDVEERLRARMHSY